MALFDNEKKDGIQICNKDDYCFKCVKPGEEIKKTLEYKEGFKLNINGNQYCLCLKHLAQMLGEYCLVHKEIMDTYTNDNDMLTIPYELAENGTLDEVNKYIERAINGSKK